MSITVSKGKARCDTHGEEGVKFILGKHICFECTINKLDFPLKDYQLEKNRADDSGLEFDVEAILGVVRQVHDLTLHDVLMMGLVYSEWFKRMQKT